MSDEKTAADKPAAKKAQAKEVTIIAASPIEHDGEAFAIGDEITLEARRAEALIAAGAATRKA